MAHSLEARVPFLDYRLVELLFSLGSAELIERGRTKAVLRRALGDLLPPVVRDRVDKLGFVTPEAAWLRNGLGELAADVFASRELPRARLRRRRCRARGASSATARASAAPASSSGARSAWSSGRESSSRLERRDDAAASPRVVEPEPDVVRRRRPDPVRRGIAGVLPRDRPAHLPSAVHAPHRGRERQAVLALRRLRLARGEGRARRRDRQRDRDADARGGRRERDRRRPDRLGRRDDAAPARRVRPRGGRQAGRRRAAAVRRRELRPRLLVGRDPPLERHGPGARRARARDAARAARSC